MVQIVIGIVIAFFTIVGFVEFLMGGARQFFMPPENRVTFMVRVKGRDEEIEYLVRSLAFKAKELKCNGAPAIVIVDEGMDEETLKICGMLSQEIPCVRICRECELADVLCSEKIPSATK